MHPVRVEDIVCVHSSNLGMPGNDNSNNDRVVTNNDGQSSQSESVMPSAQSVVLQGDRADLCFRDRNANSRALAFRHVALLACFSLSVLRDWLLAPPHV